MKFIHKLGSLVACAALTGATLLFNVPKYSVSVQAAAVIVEPEATSFQKVSCGMNHTLALDSFGNLWAFGSNSSGQLGDGTKNSSSTPIHIMPGTYFMDCSAGDQTSMAVSKDGTLYGWGTAPYQEGSFASIQYYSFSLWNAGKASYVPTILDTENKYIKCNAGPETSVGLREDGTMVYPYWSTYYSDSNNMRWWSIQNVKDIFGWSTAYEERYLEGILRFRGGNYLSKDGTYSFLDRISGPGSSKTSKKVAGIFYQYYNYNTSSNTLRYAILDILSDGTLERSGYSDNGGYTGILGTSSGVETVLPGKTFIDADISKTNGTIFFKENYRLKTAYAIDSDGYLWSWGYNGDYSMTGISGAETSPEPKQVSDTLKFKQISAGGSHVMAISNDGKLYGWGYGGDCRLGDPKITGTQKTPALIDFSASKCQFKITANIGETYSGKITNSSGTAFAVDTQPTKGVFAFTSAGDGSFTYTPNDDAKGTDFAEVSFSFNGTKYSYLVNIVLNHLPSFGTTSLSKTTPQKTAFSDGIFGVDADGDALSYSISSLPKKGDFTINNSTGEYTYTPFDTSAGDDSFGIAISDGKQYVYSRIYVHIESSIITIESGGNFSLNLASASTLVGNVGATDADGDPLSYSLSLAPLLGNVILGADGSYTYTALSSSCGTDSFAITVTDGVTPVVLRYKIVLYSIKDAGTVIDHSIPINSTFVGSLLTTFENTTPQYSIVTNPKKGTVNISSSTGEYTYTAGSGFAGSDSFTVTVDYGYGSYSKTINMYLDTAPDVSAVSTHITTNQGVTYSGTVQATDLDAGAVLSYSVSEEPKKGSVSLNEYTGSYSYVPLATAAGDDQFTADVSDGTNVVHVVIYVHIETAIVSDTTLNRVTSQNVSLSGSIVASDADGDTLSYSIDTQASHGVASVESTTGKYVYIPTTNYYGSDSFVVKITDGSNPVLVTINVKVNQKPTTSAPTQNFSTKGQSVSGNANCADPDGDALTYSVSTQPTMGSVILDSSTGVFAYTPNVDAAGNDTFKITATDGCDDIIVTVTVHNETDLIIATQETSITVNQGKNTSGQVSASDADGDTLKYSVSASPSKGTLALNENTGAWTYLANSDAKGTDSFTVSVTDGNVAKTITYSLKINAPAEFASTTKTSVTTNQGENYTDTVSATDADGDKLTYSVVQQGSKGEVTINPETGRYVYVPKTGAAGDDSFVLGVTDGNFTTELTIKMHIESPITVSTETQKAETSQGDIATGSISASDPDGDTLTYSISQQGTKGTASVSNDGKWSYFASNSAGNDTFVIAVSDGSHTVYVTVSVHINSKPGFDQSSSNVSVGHGQSVSGDASASDADGDALTFTVSTQPQYGTVDLNSTNGHFTYTSLSSSTSSKDSFVVAVTDGNTTAYMTVNVTINNAPTAQNVSIEVAQGGSKSGQVSATDSDNDVLSYSIGSQGAKGTATINTKTGAFEYVANHDSTGEDVFTVEISDGLNKTVISVKVTIHANQAPAVDNTTANVTNGQSTSGKINATDPNGNPLDFTISQQGTKGVASINATTGEYVYKANLNASGTDTFSVAISNGYNVSNVTVTVSINTTAMTAVLGAVGIIAYTGVVIAAVKLISKGSKKHLEGGAGK